MLYVISSCNSNVECRRLASASKDYSVRVWDVVQQQVEFILNGHTQNVTSVKWGGMNLIYTASKDRTVKVWRSDNVIQLLNQFFYYYYFSLQSGRIM